MQEQIKHQVQPALMPQGSNTCFSEPGIEAALQRFFNGMQPLALADAKLRRIGRRVARATGLPVEQTLDDLLQNFYMLALERGLEGKWPDSSLEQYATHLMYEASKPLCTARRHAMIEHRADGAGMLDMPGRLASTSEVRQELADYQEWLDALGKLRQSLRQPALRVWGDGLSVNQVADELGITPNATSLRLLRARHLVARSVRLNPRRRRQRKVSRTRRSSGS